ncbi:MAG: methylenetetrahydrofolate--tRNA-(uracil(54)-C(5))-methyltransferase (FADH(2)-oxidizing) TrmFO [Thermodesulfobacteriota bacterium]|nr:methylenetetrahydrofolate--tRNA-(uracil(54)-C(5))-methyltransferase (FADH(2)-oxidizing) TrmFO [Thermodesulfobacteriota bacterium]
MQKTLTIIGGGLAGCEAAWQAAKRGIEVQLFEMKPKRFSPAHRSENFAELVCSNSFRAISMKNAAGLLKEEMRILDSLIIKAADKFCVPAGKALAVDRELFSGYITKKITENPQIHIHRVEVNALNFNTPIILATGPLTSDALSEELKKLTGKEYLYFYDAISPIVEGESLDNKKIYKASRYMNGEGDYLNSPLTKEEYYRLVDELVAGEKVPFRKFEKPAYFEGCIPIEVLAERGKETLAFGPLKPVGLVDPKTGKLSYAVVQFRKENVPGTLYNLVGFQTRLTQTEQKRIFRMIPGMEKATFVRYGSLHRNTFINAPALIKPTLQLKKNPYFFVAGQLSGVEGYMESTAVGLIAGINAAKIMEGKEIIIPFPTTAIGSLINYISQNESRNFQPMNINYGLFPPLENNVIISDKKEQLAKRAIKDTEAWRRLIQ